MKQLRCIFFDLDGTLLDTLPDLAFALNQVLRDEGRESLPLPLIRPSISHGAPGMVRLAFGEDQDHDDFARRMARLREIYQAHIADNTRLFDGMEEVLESIENHGLAWGVVTNKKRHMTQPLLERLGLHQRLACVIAGDDTLQGKPHPAPLWLACRTAGVAPNHCVYVGDHQRDIEAGQRAGLGTIAAVYGYLAEDDDPSQWGADAIIEKPLDLLQWLS